MFLTEPSKTPLLRNSGRLTLVALIMAGVITVAIALAVILRTPSRIPQPVYQLELQNLILDSCTDCRPNEIVYQQGRSGIVAEFQRRDSACPHVVIGSRFATLGVKQVVIAEIDGRNQQLPVGSAFQSCLIKWQVQFSGG